MRLASLSALLTVCSFCTYAPAQPGGGNDGILLVMSEPTQNGAYPTGTKAAPVVHYTLVNENAVWVYVEVFGVNEGNNFLWGDAALAYEGDGTLYFGPSGVLPDGEYTAVAYTSEYVFATTGWNFTVGGGQALAPDLPPAGKDAPVSVQINFPDDGDVFNKGATVGISSTAFVPANVGGAWFCCEVTLNGVFVYEEWAYVYAPGETIYWPACGPLTETGTYRIRTWSTAPGSSDNVVEISVVNP